MSSGSKVERLPRTVADMQKLVGTMIGVSDWIVVDQSRIDAFADVTADHQYIHVDPKTAATGPYGGTIAHGFLTLSLFSEMAETGVPPIAGVSTSLNYGFDRLRFLAPVRSGSQIRGQFTLDAVTIRASGQTLFRYKVEVEIKGETRPALAAEWLVMTISDTVESE